MKSHIILLLVFAASIAAAADGGSPEVQVTRLGETLYELTTDQGSYTTNSLVSVGDDGLLIVDTQSRKDSAAFRYCQTAAAQNPDSDRIGAFLEELTGRPSPAS